VSFSSSEASCKLLYSMPSLLHYSGACNNFSLQLSLQLFAFLVIPVVVVAGWLSSRVVSMLDSGAEGPGFKSQPRRCRVTVVGQTVHTHCASVL